MYLMTLKLRTSVHQKTSLTEDKDKPQKGKGCLKNVVNKGISSPRGNTYIGVRIVREALCLCFLLMHNRLPHMSHKFIISQFFWVRNPGTAQMEPLLRLHQAAIKVLTTL